MRGSRDLVAVVDRPPTIPVDGVSEVLCIWCGRVSELGPACHRCGSPILGSPPIGPETAPPTVMHGFDSATLMQLPEAESESERANRRERLRAARRRWLSPQSDTQPDETRASDSH
jgi:hypothetical protein